MVLVKKVGLFLVIYGKTKPLSKRKKAGNFVRSFSLFYLYCHERATIIVVTHKKSLLFSPIFLQLVGIYGVAIYQPELCHSEQKNDTRKGTEKSQTKPWAMESGTKAAPEARLMMGKVVSAVVAPPAAIGASGFT